MNISEYRSARCRSYDNPHYQAYSVCDGSPLRLADSQFGPVYGHSGTHDHNNYYYIMKGNRADYRYKNFHFMLSEPTRLAKIRLHYYSDILQRKILPIIYFYATRDDQLVYSTSHAFERLGVVGSLFSETVNGPTNVTISVLSSSLAYSKVVMHISFIPNERYFYLSEVEFFALSVATTNSSLLQGTHLMTLIVNV